MAYDSETKSLFDFSNIHEEISKLTDEEEHNHVENGNLQKNDKWR